MSFFVSLAASSNEVLSYQNVSCHERWPYRASRVCNFLRSVYVRLCNSFVLGLGNLYDFEALLQLYFLADVMPDLLQ